MLKDLSAGDVFILLGEKAIYDESTRYLKLANCRMVVNLTTNKLHRLAPDTKVSTRLTITHYLKPSDCGHTPYNGGPTGL